MRYVLVLTFLLALFWRVGYVDHRPMEFHPMLHYENALVSRVLWFRHFKCMVTEGEKEWLGNWKGRFKAIPLVETLTALGYATVDREVPGVGRVFNSCFWLLGGIALYALLRKLKLSLIPAYLGLVYYLFNPFGIVVSSAFQHEAVMVAGFLVSLFLLLRTNWEKWESSLLVALLIGVLLALKPGFALLPILAVWAVVICPKLEWKRWIIPPILMVLPSILWIYFFLDASEGTQWKWNLLGSTAYYWGWLGMLDRVIGWPWLVLGGACLALIRRHRDVAWSLFLGYVAFALLFNYASMTHDYYAVITIPILAILLALAMERGLRYFQYLALRKRKPWNTSWQMPIAVGLFVAGKLLALPALPALRSNYNFDHANYRKLGQLLGPGTKVLALCHASEYGMPLQFEGLLNVQWWPNSIDLWKESLSGVPMNAQSRFMKLQKEFEPRYFIVMNPQALREQNLLNWILETGYTKIPCDIDGYSIYDLEKPRTP